MATGGEYRTSIPISDSGAMTRPLKTAESVARNVVRDIVDEGLRPGESLIPETAMLDKYGVSRESLREGLRLLEVQGLISIRRGPGGGPVVGTVDPASLGRISTLYFHLSGATYGELFEAWIMGESILAGRAARNTDAEARLVAMGPYLDEHAKGNDMDLDAFVESHSKFHQAVATLVSNRILELTLQSVGRIVAHHVSAIADPRRMLAVFESDHRAVARAIVSGHPRRASELMEAHIGAMSQIYEEALGDQLSEFIEWL